MGQASWGQGVGQQAGPMDGGSLKGLGSPSSESLGGSQELCVEHCPTPHLPSNHLCWGRPSESHLSPALGLTCANVPLMGFLIGRADRSGPPLYRVRHEGATGSGHFGETPGTASGHRHLGGGL